MDFIRDKRFKFVLTAVAVTEVTHLLDFSLDAQIHFFQWILNNEVVLEDVGISDISRIIELTEKHSDQPMDFANITKEFSHRLVDYDLTQRGVLQSVQTAKYFSTKSIDAIFCSPLKRAKQTADFIAREMGMSCHEVEEFREVDVGDLEAGGPTPENWSVYHDTVAAWYNGATDMSFPNGENFQTLLARFKRGLELVLNGNVGRTFVIVGHAGIFTSCITDLCNVSDRKHFASIQNHNCSISVVNIDFDANHWNAKLVSWADHAHLTGDAENFVNGLPEKSGNMR